MKSESTCLKLFLFQLSLSVVVVGVLWILLSGDKLGLVCLGTQCSYPPQWSQYLFKFSLLVSLSCWLVTCSRGRSWQH